MFTILISDNEDKAREIISEILKKQGYDFSIDKTHGDLLKIIKKEEVQEAVSIEDKVVQLEEALHEEKRGALYKSVLQIIEKPLLEHVLERTEGNQVKAAKILGINRNTMRSKLKKLGINTEAYKYHGH